MDFTKLPIGSAALCTPANPELLFGSVNLDYPFPPGVKEVTALDHASLNWLPCGHPPIGISNMPHLDAHFYYVTPAFRNDVIKCTTSPGPAGPDVPICFAEDPHFGETLLATDLPSGFEADILAAVPGQGLHYAGGQTGDWFSPEPYPQWIVGGTDDQLCFVEPMIPIAFMLAPGGKTYEQDVSVPLASRSLYPLPDRFSVTATPSSAGPPASTVVIVLTGPRDQWYTAFVGAWNRGTTAWFVPVVLVVLLLLCIVLVCVCKKNKAGSRAPKSATATPTAVSKDAPDAQA